MSVSSSQRQEWTDTHWLVLAYPNNPEIRIDARFLDRVFAEGQKLVMSVGEFVIEVPARSNSEAATIAGALAPYTRAAPITLPTVYEEAKRRLDAALGNATNAAPPVLLFGDRPVRVSDALIYIGTFVCRISDAIKYADQRAELPLPDGRVQAAVALLAVADRRRKEDVRALAERIREYETMTARKTIDDCDPG